MLAAHWKKIMKMPSSSIVVISLVGVLVSMATAEVPGLKFSSEHESLHPRIIGGTEVQDRCKSPFNAMVALQFSTDTGGTVIFCSAVMWTPDTLLTTGTCLEQIILLTDLNVMAVIGERDRFLVDRDEQKIKIVSSKAHPGFNATSLDNNIAILRLEVPANLTSCVQPALRMETDATACLDFDQSCLMVGWGPYAENSASHQNPTNSRLPRYASVTVLGDDVSNLVSYSKQQNVPVGSVFADTLNIYTKACYFDWAGFVGCIRNGKTVLFGLIGATNCNSETNSNILVTSVSYYEKWITTCLGNWERC